MDFQHWLRHAASALSESESPKRDAEILLTSGTSLPPADLSPALKWVQFYFAGVDRAFQQDVALRGGVQLTSASGTMISQMGEYVMMALLMLGHKAPEMFRFQQQKIWHEHRIEKLEPVEEVIIATNASVEGESTALFIQRQVQQAHIATKLSRLARGIPVGVDLEYADQITLSHALEGRRAL